MPAKATRDAFGEALARVGERYPNVVALDADLAKSTKSELFAKKFPGRFFEMGIAEANIRPGRSGVGGFPDSVAVGLFTGSDVNNVGIRRRDDKASD